MAAGTAGPGGWLQPALAGRVRCVIFLRSDIYELLQFGDRDKFRGDEMWIDWSAEALVDLAVTRARASVGENLEPGHLWSHLFPGQVDNTQITQHLVSRTLMRPRDLIQLCNACRDTAEKNGRDVISDVDVREATARYSYWKLQDLVNEWRVNYPFLNDLFVLFQSSGYLVTRTVFARKLDTVRDALAARYPEFANVLSVGPLLRILYAIGFLGVIRAGETRYAYTDPKPIDQHESQFVIHPSFREALRSVSSVDLRPYEPAYLAEEVSFGGTRGFVDPVVRGTRGTQAYGYAERLLERVRSAILASTAPDDVRDELLRNLALVEHDLSRHHMNESGDLTHEARDMFARVARHLRDVRYQLNASGVLTESRNDRLTIEVLEDAQYQLTDPFGGDFTVAAG